MKIAVIGGGAAGLVAAIHAAQKGHKVVLLERNSCCGKKLLITGNGRCNYYNEDQNIHHYHSTDNQSLLKILTKKHLQEVLSFFDHIGIIPKIKNGYYYPYSNQATSIKDALLLQAQLEQVVIQNDVLVKQITKDKEKFYLQTTKGDITADRIILTTGSAACSKTGSDGNGYGLVTPFSHNLIPILPSLVPLVGAASYYKKWAGVRCDVILSLYEDNKKRKEEKGEIQLTDYGISGICTFNLSGFVAEGLSSSKKERIDINFVPFLETNDSKKVIQFLENQNQKVTGRSIQELLEGFLNDKLISVILSQSGIRNQEIWKDLSSAKKKTLVKHLLAFPFYPTKTESLSKAQVCKGGIPLSEINPLTMESKKVDGLFFAGEILDVDGDCGGYNLTFAFLSGMIAGRNIS